MGGGYLNNAHRSCNTPDTALVKLCALMFCQAAYREPQVSCLWGVIEGKMRVCQYTIDMFRPLGAQGHRQCPLVLSIIGIIMTGIFVLVTFCENEPLSRPRPPTQPNRPSFGRVARPQALTCPPPQAGNPWSSPRATAVPGPAACATVPRGPFLLLLFLNEPQRRPLRRWSPGIKASRQR